MPKHESQEASQEGGQEAVKERKVIPTTKAELLDLYETLQVLNVRSISDLEVLIARAE